ncbi:hypothetical protein ACIPRD_10910 [Streptomyces sp. NPDC090108]|uniref:hypothetical protein n=1 Tax=Streptomyces sp. NPDC090108 TaxID=3365947 RepID=UPI0038278A8F
MSRLLDAPGRPAGSAPEPRRHRRAPAKGRTRTRRAPGRILAFAAALCALALAACAVPGVRHQLRASFTRLPSPYTELYFAGEPSLSHGEITAPVTLVAHGGSPGRYRLRTWVTTAGGRVTGSRTDTVAPRRTETPTTLTARLPAGGRAHKESGAFVVHVALVGQTQSLHFTLRGTP